MTPAEFINTVDMYGGLEEAFNAGYKASDLDATSPEEKNFKVIIDDAWYAWDNFQEFRDDYYSYVEKGNF